MWISVTVRASVLIRSSFAAPLGVGLTNMGEYMDIEVLSTDDSKTMVRRMNETMVEGMEVVSYRQLDDSSKMPVHRGSSRLYLDLPAGQRTGRSGRIFPEAGGILSSGSDPDHQNQRKKASARWI